MRKSSFSKFDGWWHENHASAVLVAVVDHCPAFAAALIQQVTGSGESCSHLVTSREVTAAAEEPDDECRDDRRRIDVLLSGFRGTAGLAVGVEVKLDAPFRKGQLPAYHAWLSRDGSDGAFLGVLVPDYRRKEAEGHIADLPPGCPAKVVTWQEVVAAARRVPSGAPGRDWAADLIIYVEEDLMGTFPGLGLSVPGVAQTGDAMRSYLHLLLTLAPMIGAKPTKARLGTNAGPWKNFDYVSLFIGCKRGPTKGWLSLTSYEDRRGAGGGSVCVEAQFGGPPTVSLPLDLAQLGGEPEAVASYLAQLAAGLKAELATAAPTGGE